MSASLGSFDASGAQAKHVCFILKAWKAKSGACEQKDAAAPYTQYAYIYKQHHTLSVLLAYSIFAPCASSVVHMQTLTHVLKIQDACTGLSSYVVRVCVSLRGIYNYQRVCALWRTWRCDSIRLLFCNLKTTRSLCQAILFWLFF